MTDSTDPKSNIESNIGYKNPPKHTQFKKGQSGNPKGRPKTARGLKTDLKAELISKMNIRMNGQDISGTKQQLMLRTLTVRAASGDISATRILINLVMQVLGPDDHDTGPKKLSALDQDILDQLLNRQSPDQAISETPARPISADALIPHGGPVQEGSPKEHPLSDDRALDLPSSEDNQLSETGD